MLFKQVAGNNSIKEALVQQVKHNRVSHAQLFFGPEGSGCLPMAIAFSQYISCLNKQTHDSCGTCSSCIKFEKLVHPDFHMVFPVNTNNQIKKEPSCDDFIFEWRKAILDNPYLNLYDWLKSLGIENKQGNIGTQEGSNIIKKLNLTTYESEYKIMLIWMPECMNHFTANKLLKILEEPPDKTIFLLVAESREQLMTTIQSRTQALRFKPVEDGEIQQFLIEELSVNSEKAFQIAAIAEGNLNLALKLSQEAELLKKDIDEFLEWMRICFKINMPKLLVWVDKMSGAGRENQKNFLAHAVQLTRQTLMLNLNLPQLVKLSDNDKELLKKFSQFVNAGNCDDLLQAFDKAYYALERNANGKMLFLNLSFRVSTLLNRKTVLQKVA
ncbi:MAG TPA: DNA polymerase III subunit delta [Bacteroidia bacterium]|nr:DNA polymerase III subunit delta [Bacteroidia bacterium]